MLLVGGAAQLADLLRPFHRGHQDFIAVDFEGRSLIADPVFNALAFGVLGITTALYAIFW